ncbi:TetR/AcrR family transcriptional regulator [Pseudonocardia thermophila]|uniref:TetR/AcrR family transcriptional regulator n=1 Tax=Pseudonocardia thermophila TaxID=1848 RepID=UPI0013565002|nr:TetR/AcrR family transcriptional regulator [Pseudonocardia thermophila]
MGARDRPKILAATIELLKSKGYAAVTIEAIAKATGVSKVTIYRWWPNRAAVVMDAFLEYNSLSVPFEDAGSARETIRKQMSRVSAFFAGVGGEMMRGLIANCQTDPELAEVFRTDFLQIRHEAGAAVVKAGVENGELRPDIDVQTVLDALYAPLYHRLLTGHAPIDEEFLDRLVDTVFRGITRNG